MSETLQERAAKEREWNKTPLGKAFRRFENTHAAREERLMIDRNTIHRKLGDVPAICPICQGYGWVEGHTTKPWQVGDTVECERCRGTGEVWVEAPEEP